ncbi:MAG: ABC transporter permease [Pelosinus sp.]|nr:ABC transporter permease [Pelosinus sp.]
MGALKILRRHMIVFGRAWKSSVVYNFIEPLLYLSAMGFGLGGFVQDMDGVSYMQFIAPGMVASSAMWAATFECTYGSFVRLHYQKSCQAMLSAPMVVRDIVIGDILFGIVKNIMVGIVIILVIAGLGQVRSLWVLLIPFYLILPGLVFSLWALAYTCFIKNIDHLNYYITLIMTPVFLFSGVFFPVASMPQWVQVLSWLNPLYHSVEVCRALTLGNISPAIGLNTAALIVLAVVTAPWPIRFMRKQLIN